jgi:general stress protein YciG
MTNGEEVTGKNREQKKSEQSTQGRGLAAADPATRERVARAGGEAPHEVRGLQASDPATRERVARAGGEARAMNPASLAEAGRKGGEAVVEKYGPEHMAEIGRRGGESSHGGGRKSAGAEEKKE